MYHFSPETLIKSYALGVFPMAESHDDERIFFVDPEQRGIIPLHPPHLSRSARRLIRRSPLRVTANQAFAEVIDGCREITDQRTDTWINPQIRQLYCALHKLGFAHSLEVWQDDTETSPQLVGGIYGVALAGAFFGESMFSRVSNASKLALLHLMARLRYGGFTLFDTQFINPHLVQFGCVEIPRQDFHERLQSALQASAHFPQDDDPTAMLDQLLQDNTVIS
jgi:leucyl/phenylalanyl-tRNA--protein transferase